MPTTETKQNGTEPVERTTARTVYRPQVDVIETPDGVQLVANVPGVSENDLDISLEKEVLTVRGRVTPLAFEGYTLTAGEYGVGDWERSFKLSSDVDRARIEATVKDGVLRMKLPKSTEHASRKITVTAG